MLNSELVERFKIDLKTFFGLAMPILYCQAIIKQILRWFKCYVIVGSETKNILIPICSTVYNIVLCDYTAQSLFACTKCYSAAANQKNRALFDKSTKIGAHVDYHPINIFGYGSAHRCTLGSHSNSL